MRAAPGRSTATSQAPLAKLLLAFACVYLIWGSTYLGIRFAIETMPPLTMAALRFSVAGGLLLMWVYATTDLRPTLHHWKNAAVTGTFLLAGGNGGVVIAEQWIASGLAALLVATVPLWLVLIDGLIGSGDRPSARSLVGLVVGFGGVVLLTGSPGAGGGGRQELIGTFFVLGGSAAWAMGSVLSKHAKDPPPPLLRVALQMLSGSGVLTLLAFAFESPLEVSWSSVSLKSWLALAYLIVFGALIAYTAYIWLLGVTTPARAGTYAYVNPIVAMILGWWLASEPITFQSVVAGAIILGSVVLITTDRGDRQAPRGVAATSDSP